MQISDLDIAKKMVNLKNSANSRNLEFDLKFSDLKSLLTRKTCYFTGRRLDDGTRSFDRVDNDLGYITGNVVACDKNLNNKKANLTIAEIEAIYEGIQKLKAAGKIPAKTI
jgi:hypothetical protein